MHCCTLMPIFSALLIIFTYIQIPILDEHLGNATYHSQKFCLDLLDTAPRHLPIYRAIVCGKSPSHGYESLRTAGLWHILVVSAGHLQVLDYLLRRFPLWFQTLALISFSFLSGAQPPILRSLLERFVKFMNDKLTFSLLESEILLFGGVIHLLALPSSSNSMSLQLSWLCALALHIVKSQSEIKKALFIYLIISPLFLSFSPQSPLSIFYNLLLAPVLAFLLFPLCLVAIAIPWIWKLNDLITDFVLILCEPSTDFKLTLIGVKAPTKSVGWLYVLTLQILVLIRERKAHGKSHLA